MIRNYIVRSRYPIHINMEKNLENSNTMILLVPVVGREVFDITIVVYNGRFQILD